MLKKVVRLTLDQKRNNLRHLKFKITNEVVIKNYEMKELNKVLLAVSNHEYPYSEKMEYLRLQRKITIVVIAVATKRRN